MCQFRNPKTDTQTGTHEPGLGAVSWDEENEMKTESPRPGLASRRGFFALALWPRRSSSTEHNTTALQLLSPSSAAYEPYILYVWPLVYSSSGLLLYGVEHRAERNQEAILSRR